MSKKKKKDKVEKVIEERILRGKCLKCGKKMGRNFNSCSDCRRKERLKRKANKRGKPKNYYIKNEN